MKSRIPLGDPAVFDAFRRVSASLEFQCERKVISERIDALSIYDKNGEYAFWFGAWTDSWIVCFPGPKHFKLPNGLATEEAIRSILCGDLTSTIKMSQIEWSNLVFEHERSYFSQRGWHRLDSGDADAKWTRFLQIFSDGKIVGLPWIKWEIPNFANLSKPVQIRHADELRTSILRAMKQYGAEEDWFALDFNHPCYSFRPQEIDETLEDWPIPILLIVDPGYFTSANFDCGVITELDSSVTIFGKSMIDAIERESLEILSTAKMTSSSA